MAKAQAPAQVGDKVEFIATETLGVITRINPDGSLVCTEDEDGSGKEETFTPDEVILLVTGLEF